MAINKRNLLKAKEAKHIAKRRAAAIQKEGNAQFRKWEAEQAALRADERRRERLEAHKKADALIEKHGLIEIIRNKIREAIDRGKSSLNYMPLLPSGDPWNKWSYETDVIHIVYKRAVKELKLRELGYKTRIDEDELIIAWK